MSGVMTFEEFKYIMNQIKAHSDKMERVSDFFEKELCTDSWCLVNVGEDLANTLCCMLADHFNCWWGDIEVTEANKIKVDQMLQDMGLPKSNPYSRDWWLPNVRRYDNDIEYWLYEDNKKVTIDGKEVPIDTLEQFYNYLITYCVDRK